MTPTKSRNASVPTPRMSPKRASSGSRPTGTSVTASGNGAQPGEAANSPGAVAGAAAQGQGGATGVSSAAGGGGAAAASGAAAAANATGAPGQAAGSALAFGQGPNCRADGRQKGISRYMPPCVKFIGDNGGATSPGGSKDRGLVIRYITARDPRAHAILHGAQLAGD